MTKIGDKLRETFGGEKHAEETQAAGVSPACMASTNAVRPA